MIDPTLIITIIGGIGSLFVGSAKIYYYIKKKEKKRDGVLGLKKV
jgi:hypothetical protein